MGRLSPEAYAEVYEVLNQFAFVYDKIPKEQIRFIKRHASKTYVVKYPKGENILAYISQEALELYMALYLEYAASDFQREELKQILINNDMKQKAHSTT